MRSSAYLVLSAIGLLACDASSSGGTAGGTDVTTSGTGAAGGASSTTSAGGTGGSAATGGVGGSGGSMMGSGGAMGGSGGATGGGGAMMGSGGTAGSGGGVAAGEPCGPSANGALCAAGLVCCYPCGIPECNFVCTEPCQAGTPGCGDNGCLLVP